MGMFRPPGVRLFGSAFFDDDSHTASNDVNSGWNQLFIGRPGSTGGRDFGIRFDGEGDYAEIVRCTGLPDPIACLRLGCVYVAFELIRWCCVV
jgi:hypothetical protein